MTNENLFAALRNAFPADPEGVAVEIPGGRTYSWRELEQGSARIANLLVSLQLPEGARIAVQTEKSAEALMIYLAVLRAGYVHLPLNTAYLEAELDYFLGDAEPSVVVCSGKNLTWVSRLAAAKGIDHVFTLNEDGTGTLPDRAKACSDQHTVSTRRADDLAVILYTSGTTGRSKGAMLTHGNMLSNARTLKDYWGWQPGDVLLHALPIFHIHGLFVAIHGALLNGSRMIWLPKFDAKSVVECLPRATVFMGVPTMYVRLLAEPGLTKEQCANMRLFVSGSAPLLLETFDEFRARTGHTILERYGMSETVMITSNPYRAEEGERIGGTVGKPLPGVQVRVVDEKTGAPCATGEIGGIQVKGPNVFKGYWHMREKTREAFTEDGWFKTGDVGRFDERGYLAIVGRSKDLVITGGYNVYPAEVEGYINAMDGVAESAVIGVPHPDFGEAVVAVVVPRPGAALEKTAIIQALKARIAGFKVPKRVLIVQELPRNAMGKVQKNLLRQAFGDAFGS